MRRKTRPILVAAVAGVAGAWANGAAAQFASFDGSPYTQNFDSLNNTTNADYPAALNDLSAAPPSGSNMNGWYGSKFGGAGQMVYVYDTGSDTRLGLLGSFGVQGANPDTDRALGSDSSSTTAISRFGVLLKNDTQTTYSRISVSFDIEQWRRNGQTSYASNTASFKIGDDTLNIDAAAFTNVPALEWNPTTGMRGANGIRDGNAAANRAARTITNLNVGAWAPGQVLALRFDDGNDAGGDDIMAIDNFSFSAAGVAGKTLNWNAFAGGVWDTDANNKPWLDPANAPSAFANSDVANFGDTPANVAVTVGAAGVNPLQANVTNNTAAGGYTFSGGPIRGVVNKSGLGRLTLQDANDFEALNVTGGTLVTGPGGSLGPAAVLSVENATWRATGTQDAAPGTNAIRIAGLVAIDDQTGLIIPGLLSGTSGGTLAISNTAPTPIVLDAGGYNGSVILQSGTIRSFSGTNDGDLFGDATVLTLEPGTTLDMAGNGDSWGGVQGSGNINVGNAPGSFINLRAAGDRTYSGVISGTTSNATTNGLAQEGGGVLTLTGASTFVAPTSVRNGTIVLGGNVLAGQNGPLGNNNLPIRVGTTSLTGSTAGLLFNGPYAIDRTIVVSPSSNAVTLTLGANVDANVEFRSTIDLGKSSRLTSVSTGTNAVTFSGPIILQPAGTPHAITKIGAGLVVLSSPDNTYTGATNVNEGTLRVTGSIATSTGVTVNDGATFDAAATQTVKTLAVNGAGVVRVTRAATAAAPPTVLTVGDGAIAAGTSPIAVQADSPARIDLTTNGLVVDFAAGDETAAIVQMRDAVTRGYNAGDWGGSGVTSSAAATNSSRAVGYALASEVLADDATFMGKAGVDDSSVLARHTLAGDATLDGSVNFNDLVRLAQNYNTVLTGGANESWWYSGDFTYDGSVDFNDLVKLAQNYNRALPASPIPGAPAEFGADLAAAFAAVPEPSSALAALAACGLAGLRRRRR